MDLLVGQNVIFQGITGEFAFEDDALRLENLDLHFITTPGHLVHLSPGQQALSDLNRAKESGSGLAQYDIWMIDCEHGRIIREPENKSAMHQTGSCLLYTSPSPRDS